MGVIEGAWVEDGRGVALGKDVAIAVAIEVTIAGAGEIIDRVGTTTWLSVGVSPWSDPGELQAETSIAKDSKIPI